MCGTLCAPSTATAAPTARAFAASSLTGAIVPSEFDMCTTETSLVRGLMMESTSSRSRSPSPASGRNRSTAPRSFTSFCHGTRLLWCSMRVTTISSPGPMLSAAHVFAMRFMPSVVLRVQMMVSGSGAPMKRATLARASSYRSVASMLSACTPLWTLALYPS